MPIPSSGRIFWTGTNASIPSGYTRDTNFDGRFLQGVASGGTPDANGGAVTHNHTADSHVHNLTVTGSSSGSSKMSTSSSTVTGAEQNHTHADTDSESATITINSAAMIPPNTGAIVIKPDDSSQEIPDDCIVLSDTDKYLSYDGGTFAINDGTSGTTDLDDQFLLTPAAGANGGGTGGAATHTHTSPAHSHADSDFAAASSSGSFQSGASAVSAPTHHQATSISSDAVTVDSTSSEPAYFQLLGIQNIGGATATVPLRSIIAYVGTEGSIPNSEGWYLCDGTNGTANCAAYQIKCTADVTKIGDTGGSNTHTHTTTSHTHTYTFSHSSSVTGTLAAFFFGFDAATTSHTHTSNSMDSATVTMSTDDGRYPYRTVFWIQKLHSKSTVHWKGGHIKGGHIK